MLAAAAAAAAAAVEHPASQAEQVVAEVQVVAVEVVGVHMTEYCRTVSLTEESMAAVVACRHLHNAVGCMWLAVAVAAVRADLVGSH